MILGGATPSKRTRSRYFFNEREMIDVALAEITSRVAHT